MPPYIIIYILLEHGKCNDGMHHLHGDADCEGLRAIVAHGVVLRAILVESRWKVMVWVWQGW